MNPNHQGAVPTVRVKSNYAGHREGFYEINAHEFDADKHELHDPADYKIVLKNKPTEAPKKSVKDLEAEGAKKVVHQGAVPTVRVKSDAHKAYGGFMEINASDFDAAVHEKFDGEPTDMTPAPSSVPAPTNDTLLGSDKYPDAVEVGGEKPVAIGDVVVLAFKRSGLLPKKWNKLPPEQRDKLIGDTIADMITAQSKAATTKAADGFKTPGA